MKDNYTKVFTESMILVKRLRSLLEEVSISSRTSDNVESARLGGFGISTNAVELFVLNDDLKKAEPIVESFREKINS